MNQKTLTLSIVPAKVKLLRAETHAAKLKVDQTAKMARQKEMHARNRDIITLLCEKYPKCFNVRERKPLKVGIHKDILQALGSPINEEELGRALRFYTRYSSYLHALINGGNRFDLLGNVAGEVSESEKKMAEDLTKHMQARIKVLNTRPRQHRQNG